MAINNLQRRLSNIVKKFISKSSCPSRDGHNLDDMNFRAKYFVFSTRIVIRNMVNSESVR